MHLTSLIESLGADGFYRKVCDLLNEKQLSVDDFSYYELAEACGVLPTLRRMHALAPAASVGHALAESNPGVNSNLFQIVTGELIGRKVIEGYEDDAGFIGDKLVTVLPSRRRNQRLAGFTALAGPTDVYVGEIYPTEPVSAWPKHIQINNRGFFGETPDHTLRIPHPPLGSYPGRIERTIIPSAPRPLSAAGRRP